MKSFRTPLLTLLAAFFLSACLQQEKVIKLKTDGSGTIEETVVMNKEMVAQMKTMADGFGALAGKAKPDGAPASPFSVLDENKLRETATGMGEGVTLVSVKPLTTPAGEGYSAIYAFTDINKVKLDQNPGQSLPGAGNPLMKMGASKAKKEPVKFEFVKGTPASLTIKLPLPKPEDLAKERPQQAPGAADMAAMMLQQMLKGMKVSLAVEVAGNITQTNAEFREGSRVTLMQMDFDKVMADPEKFKALTAAQPKTIEEAKAIVKGTDGIKAETQPAVTIKFQ